MLHPQAREALQQEVGEEPVSSSSTDIAAMREAALLEARRVPREEVASVADVEVGDAWVRIYRPVAEGRLPVIVHVHGGGFVFNEVEVYDAIARRFANLSGMAVVSVEYRRPPESKFPAAVEDMDAVVAWLNVDGAAHGLDPDRAFLHGDSAGGNLALVAALHHPGAFRGLALIYPFIDAQMRHASYDEAVGLWNRDEARWYWEQYASGPVDFTNPDFSPYEAPDLAGLPPMLVVSSEHDPLRDEAEHFAARAADAGVECVGVRYLGQLHGFWRHTDAFDAAEPLMRQVIGFFHQHI